MKVAILGDVHGGASKSSDIIHDYFAKFYGFFYDYLNDNGIKVIIQEGDLYDYRKEIHFNTIYRFKEYFLDPLEKNGMTMCVIAGNHDVLYKNTNRINSVRLLATPNMRVVDMVPERVFIGTVAFDLFPWINKENIEESLKFAKESTSEYAIGHFEFANFPMHAGTIAETGMNHKLFSNYKEVFSGHYHTISQKDNIQYTGTPCELTWSDWADPKGFWILDTEIGVKEFVRNPYTLFEKITYVEGMSYDFTQVKDKYVKIIVVDNQNQKKFDAFLDNVKLNSPHDVKVIESFATGAVDAAVLTATVMSTHQMIANVIDSMEIELDKTRLKESVLSLYQEAMEINNAL